ncbi:hsp90 co-chaperone Cdc [Salix suchowensis]|nr:hsp90 co-chaperone Cdc [Salix suchowensis]
MRPPKPATSVRRKAGRRWRWCFFKKMIAGDKRAIRVFVDDVETTYNHLKSRVQTLREEEAQSSEGKEQIQLVAENSDTVISFNVPEGPAPDEITLEGPGTEGLDVEEAALKEGTLEGVNKVLAEMDVPEAENIVSQLDMAGILSFAEGGIRDETGKDKKFDESFLAAPCFRSATHHGRHDNDQDSTRPRLARSLSFPDTPQLEPAIAGSAADARKPRAIDPNVVAEASSIPLVLLEILPVTSQPKDNFLQEASINSHRHTREVTPWELFPPPDIGEPAVLLKPWLDYNVSCPPESLSMHYMSSPSR